MNEPFSLENNLNLTDEFFYDNFNNKYLEKFLVHVLNLMHFQDIMAHFLFLQKRRSKKGSFICYLIYIFNHSCIC